MFSFSGPLVCEFNDGKWRLMGMIAMGLDDCKLIRVAAPTVFVNVGLYRDWIEAALKQRSTVMNFVPYEKYVPNFTAKRILLKKTESENANKRVPKSENNAQILEAVADAESFVEAAQKPSLNSQIRGVFGRSG